MGPLGLPLINTAILLTSSVTVTIAHHALIAGHRGILKTFLALTFILGFIFVGLQAYEYIHAYQDLNLKLTTGIYGSTFFMLTGFHGMHVTIGAIMLLIIWLRVMKGHFTPDNHFAFEGRCLVLALRRRGLDRPVRVRLLDVVRKHGQRAGAFLSLMARCAALYFRSQTTILPAHSSGLETAR